MHLKLYVIKIGNLFAMWKFTKLISYGTLNDYVDINSKLAIDKMYNSKWKPYVQQFLL